VRYLKEYVDEAHNTAREKGWYDKPVGFPEFISNCHGELSEAFEEFKNNEAIDNAYEINGKPEGVPIELADVLIRVFDYCAYMEIDIEKAIQDKMKFNKTRSYRHGGKRV